MALDQVLLERANETGEGTLRIYQWSPATLSLGYFQKLADREEHPASLDRPVVRRSSGGGAILHDHELTYSLALPATHRWSRANERLYRTVHQSIVKWLQAYGISSQLYVSETGSGDSGSGERKTERRQKPPFLCFQRRTDGDLVSDGWKIGGSAQRRLQRSILQHGSLLLAESEFAPELPGVAELSGVNLGGKGADLAWGLARQLTDGLGYSSVEYEWSPTDFGLAQEWLARKFGKNEWISKR